MISMFSIWNTTHEILKLLLFVLPFGVLFVSFLNNKKNIFTPFILYLPLYLFFGLITLIISFFFLALFIFNRIVVLTIFIICLGLLFIRVKNMRFGHENKILTTKSSTTLLLITFSLIIFIRLAYIFEVAPPLDPLSHGMYVSLILYHHKLPTTMEPIGDLSLPLFDYPKGFHIMSAATSIINNTPPVRSMLIFATLLISMIPVLFYIIVYIRTKSPLWSLIGFFLPFIIPSSKIPMWRRNFDILLSKYIVGIYPNLLGDFIFVGIAGLSILWEKEKNLKDWIPFMILLLALFLSYYPLLVYPVISAIFVYIYHEKKIKRKTIAILLTIFAYVTIILLKDYFIERLNFNAPFNYNVYMRYDLLNISSIYWYFLPVMVIGIILSIYLILKRHEIFLPILTIIMNIFQIICLNKYLYINYLWFASPNRSLILSVMLSFLVIVISISKMFKTISLKKIKKYRASVPFIILVVIISFSFFFKSHVEYYPTHPVTNMRPTGQAYEPFIWILRNSKPTDLILNDPTIIGNYLPTFRAQAVINDRERLRLLNLYNKLKGTEYEIVVTEADNIFQEPYNYSLFIKIVKKYNIKYLFLTNVSLRYRFCASGRGVNYHVEHSKYQRLIRNITQHDYIAFFDNNPYLEIVFRNNNITIYRVKK